MTFAALRLIFGRVPAWVWILAAALAFGAWQRHLRIAAVAKATAQVVKVERDLAQLQLDLAQASIDTLAKTVKTQQEAVHAAQQSAALDRAGADAYADALRRLQHRTAAARGGARAGDPAASGGAAASGGPDMCAELLGRLGEAAGQLAAIADARGRAGAACERIGAVTH